MQIYVIGSSRRGYDGVMFHSVPMPHQNRASAEAEAKRLAIAEPDKQFIVFRAQVMWEVENTPLKCTQFPSP